ncbi:hypothetical protein B0J12DRAFT_652731 [Macrophomina phaseolina]|uniref:Uncharacterized protein n=1 Tax=Macrophomina phaseolina TaxID=35725 RepID=A0ABQ8GI03_9PEZI|nr:hypothetical protein B0J12DRAFT_652731 [Macrophomina phaseolina]
MACPQSAPPHPSSTSRPAPLGHGRSLPRSCASLHRRPACCAVQYEAPPLESAAEDIPLPMPSREIAHIHGRNLRCNEPVICSLLRPGRCPPPINPPIQLPVGLAPPTFAKKAQLSAPSISARRKSRGCGPPRAPVCCRSLRIPSANRWCSISVMLVARRQQQRDVAGWRAAGGHPFAFAAWNIANAPATRAASRVPPSQTLAN